MRQGAALGCSSTRWCEPHAPAQPQHSRSVSGRSASLHCSDRQRLCVLPHTDPRGQPGEHGTTAMPGPSGGVLGKQGPRKSKPRVLYNPTCPARALLKSQGNAWHCNVHEREMREALQSPSARRGRLPKPLRWGEAQTDGMRGTCRSRGRCGALQVHAP